jgi:hypothetical protein
MWTGDSQERDNPRGTVWQEITGGTQGRAEIANDFLKGNDSSGHAKIVFSAKSFVRFEVRRMGCTCPVERINSRAAVASFQ